MSANLTGILEELQLFKFIYILCPLHLLTLFLKSLHSSISLLFINLLFIKAQGSAVLSLYNTLHNKMQL